MIFSHFHQSNIHIFHFSLITQPTEKQCQTLKQDDFPNLKAAKGEILKGEKTSVKI